VKNANSFGKASVTPQDNFKEGSTVNIRMVKVHV